MTTWADNTVQDLRFALRSWAKAPAFAIAAIATLAIGIGANTAIFSIVSGVLLRPLPFADPRNLVQVYETQPRNNSQLGFDGPVIFQDFEQWRTESRLIEGVLTYSNGTRNFQAAAQPEQVNTVAAERGMFRLLGIRALAGRGFDDHDPADVAVLSYGFWQAYLGGDGSVIGRRITLDGQPFTVIGIMPEGFRFPYASTARGLWIPWDIPADLRTHPNRRLETVVARLKPGVAMEAARQEFNAMPSVRQGGRVVRIQALKDVVSGSVRESLLVLFGAVGMVLLVACLNVANLLLARTAARGREIAIRVAVGATRLLARGAATQIPRAEEIPIDWRVFGFLLAVCMAAGIGFGLGPAIAGARGPAAALARRNVAAAVRDALVVTEIALAFVLLVGAGLLVRTFINLRRTDPEI